MLWDVFISHASEDKDDVARPLAEELQRAGLRVWFDEMQLQLGDSLRAKIDDGLAHSRFGIVVISPAFMAKRWPQRELAGFFARGIDEEVLLPVWHNVCHKDVVQLSPMLADLVSVSTANGLGSVSERIVNRVAPYLSRPDGATIRSYTSSLALPMVPIQRAVEVIDALAEPATWSHMNITADGYPEVGWMGSNSDTVIEVLHGFACPLFAYRGLEYLARRNAALLDSRCRLNLALLEAAVEVFTNEILIAAVAPAIPYTPRVDNWRAKRISGEAQYWWQGLSRDRFDDLRSVFLRGEASVETGANTVSSEEFREIYKRLYEKNCADRQQQKALGLLGNGFYKFSPRKRPVLWRLLACQSRLYQAALRIAREAIEPGPDLEFDDLFRGEGLTRFPYGRRDPFPLADLFEPLPVTFAATTAYLKAFVMPRLQAVAGNAFGSAGGY